MNGLSYLASPYSHADPAVREHRFHEACRIAATLMKRGKRVFSPIAHSHAVEQHFSDGKIEGQGFWLEQDFAVLRHAAELLVLRLDGWERSKGIAAEVEFAGLCGIPVYYMDAEP